MLPWAAPLFSSLSLRSVEFLTQFKHKLGYACVWLPWSPLLGLDRNITDNCPLSADTEHR
jgi:hypothetical protein